jgi:malate synthase
MPKGSITEQGLRANINIYLLYQEAWFNGQGAVPLYNLMEDTATAEISRSQLWQWLYHKCALEDGRIIDPELLQEVIEEEYTRLTSERGSGDFSSLDKAKNMLYFLLNKNHFEEFLTIPAYQILNKNE